MSSLRQPASRPREISRLQYNSSVHCGPVPRLAIQEHTHTTHTYNLSVRSSASAISDQLSQVSLELDSASLSQYSYEGNHFGGGEDLESCQYMENNVRSSVDSGAMNQVRARVCTHFSLFIHVTDTFSLN